MTLLEAALGRPASERHAFIDSACDDPGLREALKDQADWEARMGSFLLDPIAPRLDPLFVPGALLLERFRIVREVGEGGMGVVYEAVDEKLNERRALKCAKPGFQRRLFPEARAAMRITHENVCRIYELHTVPTAHGPIDVLSMEFLDGETLADRIEREPRLSLSEIRTILSQLCLGLAAAHRNQLLHRDLKSNNVMLTLRASRQTHAVITDFGLAKESAPAATLSAFLLASSLRGDPGYIAPELWRGDKPSVQSDIYALGAIGYEMLTGRLPFPRDASVDSRLRTRPDPPSKLVPELDIVLERSILRCLDPNPEARFPDVEELLRRLQDSRLSRRLLTPLDGPARLALLPAATSDAPESILSAANGAIDHASEMLRRVPRESLTVIPFGEAIQNDVADALDAESKLGATHVLLTSVAVEGRQLILEAAIVDVRASTKLRRLSGRYDVGALLGMPLALAGLATSAFGVDARFEPIPLKPEAYPYYAEGLFLNRRDNRSADQAIPLFEKAIELDSESELGYAGLAEAYVIKHRMSSDVQWLERARDAIQKAEGRNPDSAIVHIGVGRVNRACGWHDKAAENFRRAIDLEPANADAWHGLARTYQLMQGRQADAAQAFQKAVELNRDYFRPHVDFGYYYFRLGNYTEAEKHFRRVVELAPHFVQGHANLAGLYADMGRYRDAEEECRRALDLQESASAYNNLGAILAYQARDVEAVFYYERALALSPSNFLYYQNVGDSYRRLRQPEEATRAYTEGLTLAERALMDNPRDGHVRSLAAYFAARLGDHSAAKREIVQALRFGPEDAKVLRMATLTYEALNQRNMAFSLLRQASPDLIRELKRQPDLAEFRVDSRFKELEAVQSDFAQGGV